MDSLLKMESLQRKIMSSNRTWSDQPDALVRANFINALPREYDLQKQLLRSREGNVTREAIVAVTGDRYESPTRGKKTVRKPVFHGQRIEFPPRRWAERWPRP